MRKASRAFAVLTGSLLTAFFVAVGVVASSAQTSPPAQTASVQTALPAQGASATPAPSPAQAVPPAPVPTPAATPVHAAACPGNPNAIGTSRTLTVDPAAFPRIGNMQYKTTLPLKDHEVVLTFDDGPLPPYTDRVLKALADQCVKATFFMVGIMAQSFPDTVRRVYNAGHTIGTHSQHHPFNMGNLGLPRITSEVDDGIASVQKAAGDPRAVAPFFRIPGLARSKQVETFAASQDLAVWSADEVADDWFHHITPAQIVNRAMRRIEAHDHRGVLLLHDIHPATAMALPVLLKELKAKGYHIVQAVPTGERLASVPERPKAAAAEKQGWPRLAKIGSAAEESHKPKRKHIVRHAERRGHRHRHRHLASNVELTATKPHQAHTATSGFGGMSRDQ
jgi:peptidoglycan/xylan/chitin deacetylase (PgdA/CDA1 family)